jgi:peptidyl-tRNA hydrolase, PTH1 family
MGYTGLVIGLGNPGSRYAWTRHNVGFAVVDHLLEAQSLGEIPRLAAEEKEYHLWKWTIPNGEWLLAKPLTFMNLSGRAVQKLMSKYFLHPLNILVIHDELDLPLGRMKLKQGGGLAGHNGLKSIAASIGSQEFYRLRIGISRPLGEDMSSYVLTPFTEKERETKQQVIGEAARVVETFCGSGFEAALQRANGFVLSESES